MSKIKFFICQNCSKKVPLDAPGTRHRNHCPYCLYSLHVDKKVGDRASSCEGVMEPIGKTFKKDGEEMVVHRCQKCSVTSKNRIAGDDSFERVEKLAKI